MATLIELCESGHLTPIAQGQELNDLPWRRLYGTPELIAWLENDLPNLPHQAMYGDLSPLEQVGALIEEYMGGEDFDDDRRLGSSIERHRSTFGSLKLTMFEFLDGCQRKTHSYAVLATAQTRSKFSTDTIYTWQKQNE